MSTANAEARAQCAARPRNLHRPGRSPRRQRNPGDQDRRRAAQRADVPRPTGSERSKNSGQAGEGCSKDRDARSCGRSRLLQHPRNPRVPRSSIAVTLPKPLTSGAKANGRFGKQDFAYLPEEDAYRCPAGGRLPKIAIQTKKTARCCGATGHGLSKLFAQVPMHARARATVYTMGARASDRRCAAAPRRKPRGDAPAARDSRAAIRHREGPDGDDTLPNEKASKSRRDGTFGPALQSDTGHKHCRGQAADRGLRQPPVLALRTDLHLDRFYWTSTTIRRDS
jgi:hypothetical protein